MDDREWVVPENEQLSDGVENKVYTHKPGALRPCDNQQLHDVDDRGVLKMTKYREWAARIW